MPHVTPDGVRAVLVGLDIGRSGQAESLEELKELASSAGVAPVAIVGGRRDRPDAATFAGRGKVDEIGQACQTHGASLVIFNHELSAGQERNLEEALKVRVIDRVSLILHIFAQRARSHEGKLQVELAQLERASTRLIRGWTHLERQRGGIGLRGGPGEKQLEIDRRLIGVRIKALRGKLARVRKQRAVQRKGRNRGDTFKISIVGYTNAGKSTLFNRLVNARAYVADQLFATLDTTTRKVFLAPDQPAVIADTVGFIRDLPHSLVEAFRATLEEAAYADLLLHVVDASSGVRDDQITEVRKVLREIGADRVRQLLVYNKSDKVPQLEPGAVRDRYGRISLVRVSAISGAGVDELRQALLELSTQSDQISADELLPSPDSIAAA
jgi:GTPase